MVVETRIETTFSVNPIPASPARKIADPSRRSGVVCDDYVVSSFPIYFGIIIVYIKRIRQLGESSWTRRGLRLDRLRAIAQV